MAACVHVRCSYTLNRKNFEKKTFKGVLPNVPLTFLVYKRTFFKFLFRWCEHLNFVPGLWMCCRKCMSAVYAFLIFCKKLTGPPSILITPHDGLAGGLHSLKVSMKQCHLLTDKCWRVAASFNYLKFTCQLWSKLNVGVDGTGCLADYWSAIGCREWL